MRSLKITVLFCEPSFGSGLTVLIGAFLLLGISNYSYLIRSDFISSTLSPKNSGIDALLGGNGTIDTLRDTVLSNPTLNKVLFFCFWMMIGLFAYITLAVIWDGASKTGKDLESSHYIHARRKLIQGQLMVRLAMQIGGILALILFAVLFSSLLLPFSVLATRVGLDSLSTVTGWGYLLLGFIVMVLSLHCFVIIGRIIMGRPRMLGGWDSILLKEGIKPVGMR